MPEIISLTGDKTLHTLHHHLDVIQPPEKVKVKHRVYVSADSEEDLTAVFEIFKEKLKDDFNFTFILESCLSASFYSWQNPRTSGC